MDFYDQVANDMDADAVPTSTPAEMDVPLPDELTDADLPSDAPPVNALSIDRELLGELLKMVRQAGAEDIVTPEEKPDDKVGESACEDTQTAAEGAQATAEEDKQTTTEDVSGVASVSAAAGEEDEVTQDELDQVAAGKEEDDDDYASRYARALDEDDDMGGGEGGEDAGEGGEDAGEGGEDVFDCEECDKLVSILGELAVDGRVLTMDDLPAIKDRMEVESGDESGEVIDGGDGEEGGEDGGEGGEGDGGDDGDDGGEGGDDGGEGGDDGEDDGKPPFEQVDDVSESGEQVDESQNADKSLADSLHELAKSNNIKCEIKEAKTSNGVEFVGEAKAFGELHKLINSTINEGKQYTPGSMSKYSRCYPIRGGGRMFYVFK